MGRRRFLSSTFVMGTVFSLLGLRFVSEALAKCPDPKNPLPTGTQAVPATDAVANAIGYKPSVKEIDFTKYPQRKDPKNKDQFCKNCALYTASNACWGKCQMIQSGLVTSDGWCGSWSKKA